MFVKKESVSTKPHFYANITTLLTLIIGLIISGTIFLEINQAENSKFLAEFKSRAGNQATTLQNGINTNLQALSAISSWVISKKKSGVYNDIDAFRSEFHGLAESTLEQYPSVKFFALSLRITESKRSYYTENARKNGFSDFHFKERDDKGKIIKASIRDEYFPTYLIEPVVGNEPMLGLDLLKEPVFGEALETSREKGSWLATSKTRLAYDKNGEYVILVVNPLYEPEDLGDGESVRKKNIFAYTICAIRFEQLITTSFKDVDLGGLDLHLYDMLDPKLPTEKRFLYESREGSVIRHPFHEELLTIMAGPHVTKNIDMAGRPWSVVLHPTPEYENAEKSNHSFILLMGGLIISFLLAAFINNILKRNILVESEVKRRTEELLVANIKLEKEIANRKVAEESVRKRDAELAHAVRLTSLGEMAAGIIHEVNQPLTAILTYSENSLSFMESGSENLDIVVDNIGKITEQVKRAKNVTQHLKTYARSSDANFTDVDINTLINEVIIFFSHQLTTHRIELDTELSQHLPIIKGDAMQLEQVFVNVLMNAIDAVENEKRRKIAVKTMTGSDNQVLIDVSDTGCGIAEEDLSRLFDTFFTTKPRGKGTGLGLSISHRIIENHKGSIKAKSDPGMGTTITITLHADQTT